MQNWYNNDNWYAPNTQSSRRPDGQPFVQPNVNFYPEPDVLKRKRGRSRVVALIISILVVLMAVVAVAVGSSIPAQDTGGTSSGDLPSDFHDYLDSYYTTTTGQQADISIEKVQAREGLSLALSDPGSSAQLTLQQIYDKCSPSIVAIKAETDNSESYSWGTGVIFASDGYIVTNTHVINESDSVTVELYNGKEYEAKLVGADSISDIAVLHIEAEGLTAAEFGDVSSLQIGDSVTALGNPLGETYKLTMTNGIISGMSREVSYNGAVMNLLQTNAAINEGNSGGPLINDRGQVIGITNMKMISTYSSIEGIGFAIPADTVQTTVNALIKDGAVYGRSTIGITIGPIDETIAEHYDIPDGLYVASVMQKSDAYKQGMRKGDIIVKLDDTEIHTTSDIADIKENLEIGDTMTFTVWRDGKTIEFTVKLMDANDIYN